MWFTALCLYDVDIISIGDDKNIWKSKLVAFHMERNKNKKNPTSNKTEVGFLIFPLGY